MKKTLILVGVVFAMWVTTSCSDSQERDGNDGSAGNGGSQSGGGSPSDGGSESQDEDACDRDDWQCRKVVCQKRSVEECLDLEFCNYISGGLVDRDEECVVENRALACDAPGCTASITFAEDPEGQLWQFADGCTPPGWRESNQGGYYDACEANGGAGGVGGAN